MCILDKESRNDGVAARPDVFPTPLDIMDLVRSQFGLGISQIFWFSMNKILKCLKSLTVVIHDEIVEKHDRIASSIRQLKLT